MKIVHIGDFENFTSQTANGVKQVVYHLAVEQIKQGNEVFVYVFGKEKKVKYQRTEEGVIVVKFPRSNFKGFIINKELREHIKQNKDNVDILHFHSVFIPSNNCIAGITDIPYVITPHGGYSTNCYYRSKLSTIKKSIYFRLFEKRYIINARNILCLDENERFQMPYRSMIDKKIEVIPNGINKYHKRDLSEARTLLFIGRLDKVHKGLDLLIRGYLNYYLNSDKNPKLRLMIVGPDVCNHRKDLEAIVHENGLEHYVEFRDKVYGTEKEKVFGMADVFVHTSRWEGLPIAVLEALAHGIPVLISKETNLGTYVQKYHAGWILTENTPENIGKTIKKVEQCNLKSHSDGAYKMVDTEFNWASIAARLLEVYKESI